MSVFLLSTGPQHERCVDVSLKMIHAGLDLKSISSITDMLSSQSTDGRYVSLYLCDMRGKVHLETQMDTTKNYSDEHAVAVDRLHKMFTNRYPNGDLSQFIVSHEGFSCSKI